MSFAADFMGSVKALLLVRDPAGEACDHLGKSGGDIGVLAQPES
jgi:hypothetical protein